jgi:hypothetical protein
MWRFLLAFVLTAATALAQPQTQGTVLADKLRLSSDGTAAAPAITWASDPNMGLFRSTTDVLALVTAGVTRVTIDANGNVGIGTTAPAFKLDVTGAIYASSQVVAVATSPSASYSGWFGPSATGGGGIYSYNASIQQESAPSLSGVQSAVVVVNGTANTGTNETMDNTYEAVKFTVGAADVVVRSVTFKVKESADITNTTNYLTAKVYTDNAGVPDTAVTTACTGLTRYGTITGAYVEQWIGGCSFTLTAGTAYWIVFQRSAAPTGGDLLLESVASGTATHAYSSNGSTWTTENNKTLYYSVTGRTAPGVYAVSTNNYGLLGTSSTSFGVYGMSMSSIGVIGTSTSHYGVQATSNYSIALRASSVDSYAVYATSDNGVAAAFASTNSVPLNATANPATANTQTELVQLVKLTSGTAAAGLGGYITWYIENSTAGTAAAAQQSARWTVATAGAETSALSFGTRIAGTTATRMEIDATGGWSPFTNWAYDLGTDSLRWRSLYAAELNVWRLVAKDVIASVGGEIWTSETTKLSAALASGAGDTTLTVYDNFLEDDDFVILKDLTNVEVLKVTSAAGGSAGVYTYSVERDKDGSGRNAWVAGVAVVSTGKAAGEGFIAQYAASASADLLTPNTPTLVGPALTGVTRTGTTWNNLDVRWVVGNLNGSYDIGANNRYGIAAGDYAETWFSMDATNGFRIMHGATEKVHIDGTGAASFTGDITAAGGTLGGWTVSTTDLYAGTGASRVQLSVAGQATYRATVLADSPVSYWTFGDANYGSGYATDSSSYQYGLIWHTPMGLDCCQTGNNTPYMGTATHWDGNLIYAYSFTGHQTQWDLGDTFTVTGWIQRSTHDAKQTILDMGTGGAHVYVSAGNVLYLQVHGGNDIAHSGAALPDDANWHRFAIVHSPDSTLIYIDGGAESHTNDANYTDNFSNPTGNLSVGMYNDLSSYKFHGLMQHLAIFSTALSSTRIAAQWTASSSTVAEGQAIWAGAETFTLAPFSVTTGGDFKALKGTLGGMIFNNMTIRNSDNTFHIDADGEMVIGDVNFSVGSPINVTTSDTGENVYLVALDSTAKVSHWWNKSTDLGGISIASKGTFTFGNGIQIGSPSGGDISNSINVTGGYYVNNTALVSFPGGGTNGNVTCVAPGETTVTLNFSSEGFFTGTTPAPEQLAKASATTSQRILFLEAMITELQARLAALETERKR